MTRHFKQIIAFSLCIIFVVSLFGCSKSSNANSNADKVKLGVIETTGYKKSSYIHFYDENMNYLYTEHNKYASLSEFWDYPTARNKTVYAIPMGKFEVREEHCILEYSVTDNTYKEYDTGLQAMNSMALSDKYVFGVNTINLDSIITQNTLGTYDEVTCKKTIDNSYISEIKVIDDQLYAISEEDGDKIIKVYVLSVDDLSTIKEYDVTNYGVPMRLNKYGNKLYLANQYTDPNGPESNKITVIDLATDEISQIELPFTYPDDIEFIGDTLIVNSYDLVANEGDQLAAIDLTSGDIQTFTLAHPAQQMRADGDYVYTLYDENFSKYKYEDGNLTLIKSVDIPAHTDSRTYYYVSAFFVCD